MKSNLTSSIPAFLTASFHSQLLGHPITFNPWLNRKQGRGISCKTGGKPVNNLIPTKITTCSLSRRALLQTISLSFLLPATAHAYSSPYKPNQKSENSLPDRRYEDEISRVIRTESGLQYFDLAKGNGAEADSGTTVFVYYTSRLRGLNGIKIQSTYDDPSSPPFIFTVGDPGVVPGLNEAIRGMKVGGKRRAVLPPQIAYSNADMKPAVKEFFARRRLLSVLETNRDATIVFE